MEPLNAFRALPDRARVWIYASDRILSPSEEERLVELLGSFCTNWKSHGRPVDSAVAVLERRFAIIAGDIPDGDISGCGIDASVHVLEKAAEELDVNWLPALYVHFRAPDGSTVSVPRSEFRGMAGSGDVGPNTPVFDLSVDTLAALRAGRFEQPGGSTWHGRVFRLGSSAPAAEQS